MEVEQRAGRSSEEQKLSAVASNKDVEMGAIG
jgi:hypothetical protein